MLEIEFRGVNRVSNKLRRLASQMPEVVDKAMGPWAEQTRGKLKSTPYPSKREGQRYVRTGRLASSWRKRRERPGRWLILNSAPYSIYVVGPPDGPPRRRQVWFHKNRWWVAIREAEKYTPDLVKAVSKAIVREWQSG